MSDQTPKDESETAAGVQSGETSPGTKKKSSRSHSAVGDSNGFLPAKEVSDPDKAYELMRAELSYEANLIAHRTNWFVASQAFFFSSLAAALDHTLGVPFTLRNSLLYPMIPWVSLIVCAVIFISVLAAIDSADKTRFQIKQLADNYTLSSPSTPRNSWTVVSGLLPSITLPIVFAACWIWILIY